MNKDSLYGFSISSVNGSSGIPVINGVPVIPETCKEFHGQAYKPTINKYFYGENYDCYICGKHLGSSGDREPKEINYCSRCGNEIDWAGIER